MKTGGIIILLFIFASIVFLFYNENKVVNIPEIINCIFEENNLKNTKIKKLGDYEKAEYIIEYMEVTQEEIEEYVNIQMESYSELLPVTDRNVVQEGDVVYVSYIVTQDGQVINQVEHDNLMVGVGTYDIQFEQVLIGKKVGNPFSVSLELKDIYGELRGCELNIVVESINYFKTHELTEQFVQETLKMSSINEYYNKCYDILKNEKDVQAKKIAERRLFESIIEDCEFLVDENEIAAYSVKFVEEHEQLAYVYGMDMQTYVREILGKDMDGFYSYCYDYGEYIAKKYLVVGAIFSDVGLEITEDDYLEMLDKLDYKDNKLDNDASIDNMIRYTIMEEKVIEYFTDKL
ncbi:MAG: hypothetical protein IJP13_04285 [Lachnospiraceae bacterium]|nr:hypothetical protein [Lachnospiraceae bacterium]